MLLRIINKLTEYLKLKIEQIRLSILARASKILSQFIVFLSVIFLGFFLIFFLSLGLGVFFNELLGSGYLGYLIIAGCHLVVLIIVLILDRTGKIQIWIEKLILAANNQIEEDESH